MDPALVAFPCIAVLGLLLFGGGLLVSLQRLRHRRLLGHADDPTHALTKAVRAHGNTAEYAAFLALLIYLAAQRSSAPWVAAAMVLATAARVSFIVGMLLSPSLARPNPWRFAGALGTYVGGLLLVLALL